MFPRDRLERCPVAAKTWAAKNHGATNVGSP
jgi:hypothetical protein